jgi:predicted TIM-barrel fold metal-dependent hydrolase
MATHTPYATGGTFYDADSHIMELPDFLRRHADRWLVDRLPPLSTASGGAQGEGVARYAETRRHSPEQIAILEQNVIGGPKAYDALGAFDSSERSYALDLLGFDAQLVFGSFALASFLHADDPRVRYGGCRAFNRAIAEFCADDPRLLAVAVVSLADPVAALREIEAALELDCAAVWVPAEPCGGRSPGHDALDPVWERLSDAGIPFMLHVGAQPIEIRDEYMNTGRPPAPGWAGGGEALRLKDFPLLHQSSEEFLSVLVLDGVLERHRGLRGGVIELGATWVPGMLRRLDHAVENLAKFAPEVRAFTRAPSQQIGEQLAFTPFPFEDVGALIAESSDDLYLFSSDYPHVEGGRNPLGRFRASLAAVSDSTQRRFYHENFARILPAAVRA